MKIVESKPAEERMQLIHAVAGDAAQLLQVDAAADAPQAIVAKVDAAMVDLVFQRDTPVAQDENPDLLLGAIWGVQLARQFNWYWADVVVDDQFEEVAIIAPQREMIIFPLSFAAAVINRQCVCTVMLAFNMLLEGQIGQLPPGSYENIMLGIHHIVPPYTLGSGE